MTKSKKAGGAATPERKDFWDEIADDVSKGYGAAEVKKRSKKDELLNEDQQPDDEKRGDS